MTNLRSTLTVALVDEVSKPARTVAQALKAAEENAKAVARSMAGAGATERFVKGLSGLKLAARDIDQVRNAWREYASAAKLAGNSTQWTKSQRADVRRWEQQTISALRAVRREQATFARTSEQAARRAAGAPAGGFMPSAAAGMAGIWAGYRARQFAGDALRSYRDYSDTNAIMRPVLDLSPAEAAHLRAEQRRLGIESRYSPNQIAEAQELLGRRGVGQTPGSRFLIDPYVSGAVNYASAMNVGLPDAIKTLEAYMFSTGKLKGVTNAAQAKDVIRRVTDYATHLSKISGLSDIEISAFFEYGGLSGHQAGLSDETVGAMAALMKRNQISGEKAGVAMRAISAKLVSPTNKGLAALSAMGINYDDFAAMQGGLSAGNVNLAMQRQFAKKLSDSQMSRIDEALNSPEIAGDRGAFTTKIGEIVSESFAKTKKGTLKAQDAKAIAKTLGQLYSMSTKVDAEGLLKAIAQAHATLGQLNAFFGFQQGSRAGAALQNWDELDEKRKQLAGTEPGYAAKIATERLESFAGRLKLLEGSIETLQIRIASSFDNNGKGGPLTAMTNAATEAGNALIRLPDGVLRLGTELAAMGATIAALRGMGAISGTLGMGGAARFLGGGSAFLGRLGLYGLGASVAYEATKTLDDNARHGTKEAGKTYTSDVLVGISNRLSAITNWMGLGGNSNVGARPAFDAQAYAARARGETSWMPAFMQAEGAKPHVDISELAKAQDGAQQTKAAFESLANVSMKPHVDTSEIIQAIALTNQLKSLFASVSGQASATLGKVTALGKVQRGNFSFGGVKGE